jgi:predicted transcriptional regulator
MSEAKSSKPVWLAFRCPPEIAKRVDELAALERRSRANWLTVRLEKLVAQPTTEDHAA